MELSSTHPFLLGLHLSLLAEAPLSLERELGLTMAYAPLGSLLHWGLSFVVLRPGRNWDPPESEITGFLLGSLALMGFGVFLSSTRCLWLCLLITSNLLVIGEGEPGHITESQRLPVTTQSDLPHPKLSSRALPSILMHHDVKYLYPPHSHKQWIMSQKNAVTVLRRPGNDCLQTLNATFSQADIINPVFSHPFDNTEGFIYLTFRYYLTSSPTRLPKCIPKKVAEIHSDYKSVGQQLIVRLLRYYCDYKSA